MEGKILGNRYELLEKIGGGGMAFVYKAKCKLLNRYVAVKILKTEFVNDEELVHRFQIEAQAAASLSHPNIVSIYDVGCEGNLHYIVMEYIDGETLKEYIEKNGALLWRDALGIAMQICSAIEQAHKNKIIHRDIKPHNILLTKDGVVKVTDFGIARATSSATMTVAGKTMGSVHYFSPEQARGGFVDEKSDLYSLGIVMYEMLTGRVPFDADTPVAVALKHIQEEAVPVIDINFNIPKGVNALVMKAISKKQSDRYQSATEFCTDINRVLCLPTEDITKSSVSGATIRMPIVDEKNADIDIKRNTRKEKLAKNFAIVTAIIIMIASSLFCLKMLFPIIGIKTGPVEDFIVDDYVGRNYYEVKGELSLRNIQVSDKKRVNSQLVEKDLIISQSKKKGDKLKPGGFNSTIDFVVSDGPKKVKIPDLKKELKEEAVLMLEELGLEYDIIEVYNNDISEGRVTRTVPVYGNQVEEGSTITVYVSKGKEIKYIAVPSVIGCTKAQAEKIIMASNLEIGDVYLTEEENDFDKVVKQIPEVGEEVEEGSLIDIYFELENKEETKTEEDNDSEGNNSEETKKYEKSIILNSDEIKEDETVLVLVRAKYKGSLNKIETILNEKKKKKEFPVMYNFELPKDTNIEVQVYIDGSLYEKYEEEYR